MNTKKASKHITKKNNINHLFISFLLLIKQFINCFMHKLLTIPIGLEDTGFAFTKTLVIKALRRIKLSILKFNEYITLCLVLGFVATVTTSTASNGERTAAHHLTSFHFLQQNNQIPVTYLFSVYMANYALKNELSTKRLHPFFSMLHAEKKPDLTKKPLHPPSASNDLNKIFFYKEKEEYIDQKKMIPLVKIPLFSWLLKEYGPLNYHDQSSDTTFQLTITIGGMLYDLEHRTKNNDPIAMLVLEFLKKPYVKITCSESSDSQSWLSKGYKFISKLLFSKSAELSFSEKLMLLTNSPYTDDQYKLQRFFELKQKGYDYQQDYTFTSYEPDENGIYFPVSSDDIIRPIEELKQLLSTDYPLLNNSDDIPATTNIMGIKFSNGNFSKIAALMTTGMCLLPTVHATMTSTIPPSQCKTDGSCNLQNAYPLYDNNFNTALQNNPTGCFVLAEDITLNTQHQLPIFKIVVILFPEYLIQ